MYNMLKLNTVRRYIFPFIADNYSDNFFVFNLPINRRTFEKLAIFHRFIIIISLNIIQCNNVHSMQITSCKKKKKEKFFQSNFHCLLDYNIYGSNHRLFDETTPARKCNVPYLNI